MKQCRHFAMFLAFSAALSFAQTAIPDWGKLIDKGETAKARTLCTRMTQSSDKKTRVEGFKCMANVALCGHSIVSLQADDAGGGSISGAYDNAAANKAIEYLNTGIKLAPEDLSIHQGRLHILEVQGRYADMAKAVDESATMYKGENALDAWLAYVAELHEARQFKAAIDFLEVLDRHYPNSNLVIGNFGAMYLSLKDDEKAIGYLKRAVELAPKDPIDNWNLARAYDFTNKDDLASELYPEAISLADEEQKRGMNCYYSAFVEKKLKDTAKACALQKENCESEGQTACK